MKFELEGITYSCREGRPEELWHIVRRLTPIIDGFVGADEAQAISSVTKFISTLDDNDADKIMFGMLKYIERKLDKDTGYAKIVNEETKTIMYPDINIKLMFQLWYKSFSANLLPFFPALTSAFNSIESKKQSDQ